jgi:hypothetical protein
MPSTGIVVLVRADISDEIIVYILRVERIRKLGITLAKIKYS